jgi:hypothetical protein
MNYILFACILIVALSHSPVAAGNLKNGVVWYARAPNDEILSVAASRYLVGVGGREWSEEKVRIKSMNPEFKWFVYNSGTDNYVPPHEGETREHDALLTLAQRKGWDAEEAYLHYFDDTRAIIQGDTILVPGWGGGGATQPEQARVPVYYKNLSRRVANFSTLKGAQLHREVMTSLAFDAPFESTDLYPDGLFLDNSAFQLFNYGTIISGGHVLEAPEHPRIGSQEFQHWHWNSNYGPFLTSLKDTLATSASWSRDGQPKYLMINIANIWDDSYVSRDVADFLLLEFQYNAVRNFGLEAIDEAHRRDVLAASAGITSFYMAGMTRAVQGREDSYSYAETLLSNLAWYLVTRTENTLFYQLGTGMPSAAGWDTLTWRGVMDVADEQLGLPLSSPYTLAEGTDPTGNRYVVKARNYENGLVALRNRGNWNQGIEPETAVTIELPSPLAPVSPEGRIARATGRISLRNGQGAILLGDPRP